MIWFWILWNAFACALNALVYADLGHPLNLACAAISGTAAIILGAFALHGARRSS